MDILTTVVFLLDTLEIQGDLKRKLHKKQIKQLENLIKILYQKSNKNINEDEYLALYSIHKSRLNSEKTHDRKLAMKNTIERLKELLLTGNDQTITQNDSNDIVISTLNKAYEFIANSIKDEIKVIMTEPLIERDLQKLKTDMSENASLEIVRLYLESGSSKEFFCKNNFISYSRLNKALSFVLNSDNQELEELKNKIIELEESREQEIELIEQVMLNYNRKTKNISLIEFQAFSSQSINRTLAILKERKSIAYPALNELYKEYQNRLRLAPFTFQSMREVKTIINGIQMTDKDYDAIEQIFIENNYPLQGAIYSYVKDAYLNGNTESVQRENLKRTVLERFGITEKVKEKVHK